MLAGEALFLIGKQGREDIFKIPRFQTHTSLHVRGVFICTKKWPVFVPAIPSAGVTAACAKEGVEIPPATHWTNLYVCGRCGRIIQQNTLKS